MKIESRNPNDLKPHRRIRHLHRWDAKDERFAHFVAEVKAVGIKQPLQITAAGEVVDGELRRQVAAKARLDSVPCVIVAEEEIGAVILGSICSRRHYSKGQRAFMLAPELDAAFQEGIKRKAEAGRAGAVTGAPVHTAELFAEQYGISARVFEQARQVHKLFAEDPAYANQMEPKIFDEDQPAGLGAIIAGYAGQKSTKGKKLARPGKHEQLDLFCTGLGAEAKRFTYWQKFDDDTKALAVPAIRQFVAAMPPDLILEFKRAIKSAEREAAAAAGMEAA